MRMTVFKTLELLHATTATSPESPSNVADNMAFMDVVLAAKPWGSIRTSHSLQSLSTLTPKESW